ncbi:MAG: TRAP transporter small permease [Rhizobiaceae bacterium]
MQLGGLADLLDRMIRIATGILMVILVAVMVAQVFYRYVLNSSLTWSEEVAVNLMIWVVFLGSAILVRRWEHVQIPTVVQASPAGLRTALIFLARLASMACMVVFLWFGMEAFFGSHHATSFTTGISTRWIKLSIPVGAALMLVYATLLLLEDIAALRANDTKRFETVTPPRSNSIQDQQR